MNTAKLTPLSDYAYSTDWKVFMPVHWDRTRRLYSGADDLCTDNRTHSMFLEELEHLIAHNERLRERIGCHVALV